MKISLDKCNELVAENLQLREELEAANLSEETADFCANALNEMLSIIGVVKCRRVLERYNPNAVEMGKTVQDLVKEITAA